MPYVDRNGRLVDKPPWGQRIVMFFWGIVEFFMMFFKSLFGNVNKQGNNYTREYRGGGGPPRPPTNRRIGGFSTLQDCNVPGGG